MHFIWNFAHCADFSCFVKCRLILNIFIDNGTDPQGVPATPTATTTPHLATSKLEPTSQPSQTPASLIVEHDEPPNSLTKIDPDLSQLSGVISPTALPNPQLSAHFLKELTSLKNLNAERDHLQLLDTIIDMTERGEISNNNLNKCIPDSIVVLHREGLDAYEYTLTLKLPKSGWNTNFKLKHHNWRFLFVHPI